MRFFIVFLALLIVDASMASYDEVYEPNGKKRFLYKWAETKNIPTLNPSEERVRELEDRPLGDKIKISPEPLLMEESEYRNIQLGLIERVRVMIDIFEMFVLSTPDSVNEATKSVEGVFDVYFKLEGWTLDELRRIWKGASIEKVRAFYGPDLYRNSEGQWKVLEDNVGNIGGRGDLYPMLNKFLHNTTGRFLFKNDNFMQKVFGYFFELIHLNPNHPDFKKNVVAIYDAKSSKDDNENMRIYQELKHLGIKTYSPKAIPPEVFAKMITGGYKAIINLSHPDMSNEHLIQFYENIIQRTDTELFIAPGSSVLSSKGLTEVLYHHFAAIETSKPLLTSPRTEIVFDGVTEKLSKELANYVLKPINGLQGVDIHFVNEETPEKSYQKAKDIYSHFLQTEKTLSMGGRVFPFVAQELVEPSTFYMNSLGKRFALDVRPLAYISNSSIVFSDVPWARTTELTEETKTNVSLGAYELPVLIPKESALKNYRCVYFFY